MAKNIDKLISGQTPSLLQADKGNELIDAINQIRESKSTANAERSGITLKVSSEGALELDVSEATANALVEITQDTSDIPEGYREQRFNATVDGVSKGTIFLVKSG